MSTIVDEHGLTIDGVRAGEPQPSTIQAPHVSAVLAWTMHAKLGDRLDALSRAQIWATGERYREPFDRADVAGWRSLLDALNGAWWATNLIAHLEPVEVDRRKREASRPGSTP